MRKPDVVHKLYRAFSGLLTDELGCSRMNVCGGGGGGGGVKRPPSFTKICHTYPSIIKLWLS